MRCSRFALVPLVVVVAAACKGSTPPASSLPLLDTEPHGAAFNPNEIVPVGALSDFSALSATAIAKFLESTPYGGASFLSTYQSNGVAATASIASAAATYRINPIVLLTALEAKAGLIASSVYPSPPLAVDYVFGCGCSSPDVCDLSLAGIDVQVACYASALRDGLDEISATVGHQTAGGWGPGNTSTSLDGLEVTPKDASTAALYQVDPVVGTGKTGTSLFENIWALYIGALHYDPASPVGPGATALIGDPCVGADDCNVPNAVCANAAGYPGGLCTMSCTGSCPTQQSFCASFASDGFCLPLCSPTDSASCRTGYGCQLVDSFGVDAGPEYVCAASKSQ